MDNSNDFHFFSYLINNADELKKFSKDVNKLSASALTQLQRLPVSLRRRAASHNVKRLPFRFRKITKVFAAKLIVKRCRKYRRRHMDIKAIFASRQMKNKWLYTHVWHAKRFKLENKWGWRIPVVPNLKTFRPCTKAMTNGCAIIDISYYGCYELSGPLNTIIDGIMPLIDAKCSPELIKRLMDGREVSCVFHEPGQHPYGAISPVTIIRVGVCDSVLVRMHPCAAAQVVAALTHTLKLRHTTNDSDWLSTESRDVILIDRAGDSCLFRLIGQDSHRIVMSLLVDKEDGRDDISTLDQFRLSKILAGHSAETLIPDPETTRPRLKQTDRLASVTASGYASPILPLVRIAWPSFQIDALQLQLFREGQTVQKNSSKHLEPIGKDEKCPIRLTRHRYYDKSPGGWDLVVPAKWSLKLWTTLIMKGARPIGQRYFSRYCAVEASNMGAKNDCYPMFGWPDTLAGARDHEETATRLQSAWSRRPRAKRVNHKLVATDQPFSCPYKSLMPSYDPSNNGVTPMFVCRDKDTLNKYLPAFLAGTHRVTVAQLDNNDANARHSLIPVMIDCIKKCAAPYAVIMAAIGGDTKDTIIEQQQQGPTTAAGAGGSVRPVLGYVEAADQSMLRGKGRGFGHVSYYRLIEVTHDRRARTNLFWIKNPNEQRLMPVTLTASMMHT